MIGFQIRKQSPAPATLSKKRLWHRCFPVNFTKFLRTTFFTEHRWWLLFQIAEVQPQSVCCLASALFFYQFQPGIAYKSIAYNKSVYIDFSN